MKRSSIGKVICGDFREFYIPKNAFFVSDPPYNQKYHYSTYGDDLPTIEYVRLLEDAFKGKKSVIILYPEETINLLGGAEWEKHNKWFHGFITQTPQSNLVLYHGSTVSLT